MADALLDALGETFTVFCPAFPANGRTIYRGHLFVGDVLLSESGMRDHPLTPMRDSEPRRVLARQTPHKVGLAPLAAVSRGAGAGARRIRAASAGRLPPRHLDAVTDEDLLTLGEALAGMKLVTGGSGLALGLPENFRRAGLSKGSLEADRLPPTSRSGGGDLRLLLDGDARPGGLDAPARIPCSTSTRSRSPRASRWSRARSTGPGR